MSARSKWLRSLRILALVACVLPSARAWAQAPKEPPAAGAPSAADREKSRAAFRKGVVQLRAQDWPGARASFEEAWSLVQHPSILLNLGIARLRTDEPVLAEQDLVRFLSEDSGATPEELKSARESLADARSKIGTLRIVVAPPAARVVLDGKPVAVAAAGDAKEATAEARLKSGRHVVDVEAEGMAPEQRAVDVPPKGETEARISLAPKAAAAKPEPAPSSAPQKSDGSTRRIVGYSLAGASGVALLTSGILAIQALSKASDYEDPESRSFQDAETRSDGIGYRTGADVAFIVALLAGAGAAVLLFTNVGSSTIARGRVPPRLEPALLRW